MDDSLAAAERFLLGHARLLERRLFATCLLGAPARGVIDALRGYQNADGGFGQCLEPDIRCPASLPIYVEIAFQALAAAGAADHAMVTRACDYLAHAASAAGAGGGVPPALPVIGSCPRAAHWTEWACQPALNPTAGLAGLLYRLGVDHPWREQATRFCWERLENDGLPGDAHALSETMIFLENVPDTDRAGKVAAGLQAHLPSVSLLNLDPHAAGYGLTPLQLAPEPGSRWRSLFRDEVISAHLDALAAKQQPDGGWPISWEPPGGVAASEWRGIVTVQALRTLTCHGRMAAGPHPAA